MCCTEKSEKIYEIDFIIRDNTFEIISEQCMNAMKYNKRVCILNKCP